MDLPHKAPSRPPAIHPMVSVSPPRRERGVALFALALFFKAVPDAEVAAAALDTFLVAAAEVLRSDDDVVALCAGLAFFRAGHAREELSSRLNLNGIFWRGRPIRGEGVKSDHIFTFFFLKLGLERV